MWCLTLYVMMNCFFPLIMDSEEDMLNAHDMESGEDDLYSGGTDDYNDSDDEEHDYEFVEEDADDSAMIASHRSQKSYCVMREEDILKHQKDDIEPISVVLFITEASILLRHFHWSVSKVHDEWFADEERVRKTEINYGVLGQKVSNLRLPQSLFICILAGAIRASSVFKALTVMESKSRNNCIFDFDVLKLL